MIAVVGRPQGRYAEIGREILEAKQADGMKGTRWDNIWGKRVIIHEDQ